ncbi:MAG: hypothetical protein K2W96_11175, partial [Gemmataceae bacterium]|nr:hypothetical protein [Gemmataceae bacterium]
ARAAGANWPRHRQCFSCHNQTLPLLAMKEAGDDPKWMEQQGGIAHAHFAALKDALLAGKHIGGGAATASHGLWALSLAGKGKDAASEAIVAYLLKTQRKDGLWHPSCFRPPSQGSYVSVTVLSAWLMAEHAGEGQAATVEAARKKAVAALEKAALPATEDAAFRLWGLRLLGGQKEKIDAARKALLALQRDDGGWAQEKGRRSDAYATGQALWVLRVVGGGEEAARRAAWFLVRTQHADGSWHVKTRAVPVQRDFDNGDPHGKDQFLSVAATSWATAALARMKR